MSDLKLEARKGHAVPLYNDDRVVLQGEREWLVHGQHSILVSIEQALPGIAEWLGGELLLLDFGNAIGLFNLPAIGMVEVISGKWDRSHYEQMLQELTEIAVGLPFTADLTAALPYDRSVATQQDVLYHLFVYLRHILSVTAPAEQRLLPALNLILQAPHQRFERTQREVDLAHVRQIHPAALMRLVTQQDTLVQVGPELESRLPLARTLRGHLPLRALEHYVDLSHDTAENRFVKSFLSSIQGIIDQMRELMRLRRRDPFRRRIEDDCDGMAAALRPVIQHGLWKEVGAMVHLPASSPVLQHRRGYREVYRHFARMRLATQIPLTPELARDLLEAKDIAHLYEIWAYFVVVREIEHLIGRPAHAERPRVEPTELIMPHDLEVTWPSGVRLLYNRTFSRSAPGERRSYSVVLRPDISLYVPGGPNKGLHLLDAKFKVDKLDTLMPVTDSEGDDHQSHERRGTFKRGDLYKMHTYRDAIPDAHSVWILYPGTETRFFDVNTGAMMSMPAALPLELQGVGAIPLLPTGNTAALRDILARVLK